jgi:membrane-associated phospholipid phosphatase
MLPHLEKSFLFWQPKKDWFKEISKLKHGHKILVFLNYIIWLFLFYVSYLLIKSETNIFWQLFTATAIGELVEKVLKSKSFWRRPLHINKNILPDGLLKSWYHKGSFPSGHAMKATFFFLFIIQYPISLSPENYLLVVIPLILIRIYLGLHYPIDIIGGIISGIAIWFLVHLLIFPDFLVNLVRIVFNFVFLIN